MPAHSYKGGIAITHGPKISFFSPHRATRCTDFAKILHGGVDSVHSMPNFAKIGAWVGA